MTDAERSAAPRSLTVRDATEPDLGAIHSIYAHHVLHGLATFEEIPPLTGSAIAASGARCCGQRALGSGQATPPRGIPER